MGRIDAVRRNWDEAVGFKSTLALLDTASCGANSVRLKQDRAGQTANLTGDRRFLKTPWKPGVFRPDGVFADDNHAVVGEGVGIGSIT